MDEDKLLEELRAQRQLIQKHLEWLDQKIASVDTDDSESTDPTSVDIPETNESPPKESPTHKPVEDNDPLYSKYKAPTGNDLHRAKIGCLVLFVLSTTLFLFLLFGLPYLLD